MEAGLDVKWRSDYDHANKIYKRVESYENDTEENTLIWTLIYIMVIGSILSIIVLIFECIWFYYLSKKIKNIRLKRLLSKEYEILKINRRVEFIKSRKILFELSSNSTDKILKKPLKRLKPLVNNYV